jgi:hypothetical protein
VLIVQGLDKPLAVGVFEHRAAGLKVEYSCPPYEAALLAPTGYSRPDPLIDRLFMSVREPDTWLRRMIGPSR